MITVWLSGGLGNQLFQYAMGRAVSIRQSTTLAFDVFRYQLDKQRTVQLDGLCQSFQVVEDKDLPDMVKMRRSHSSVLRSLSRILIHTQCILPVSRRCYYREKSHRYDDKILNVCGDVYLFGYWQSPRYFEEISDILRAELLSSHSLDEVNADIIRHMHSCDSISVHVRRGDYVHNPANTTMFTRLEPSYYQNAVSMISGNCKNPVVFMFSDDMEWALRNITLGVPVVPVDVNGIGRPYDDLLLMSNCTHNVIANSTFSWWGAWLNNNTGKSVIAPRNWFCDKVHDSRDMIPADWVQI